MSSNQTQCSNSSTSCGVEINCPCGNIQAALNSIDLREPGNITVVLLSGTYSGDGNVNLVLPRALATIIVSGDTTSVEPPTIICDNEYDSAFIAPPSRYPYKLIYIHIRGCGTAPGADISAIRVNSSSIMQLSEVTVEGKLLFDTNSQVSVQDSFFGFVGTAITFLDSFLSIKNSALVTFTNTQFVNITINPSSVIGGRSGLIIIDDATVTFHNTSFLYIHCIGPKSHSAAAIIAYSFLSSTHVITISQGNFGYNTGSSILLFDQYTLVSIVDTLFYNTVGTAISNYGSTLEMNQTIFQQGMDIGYSTIFIRDSNEIFDRISTPSAVLNECSFLSNFNILGFGAGIFIHYGNLTLYKGEFISNTARRGGAIATHSEILNYYSLSSEEESYPFFPLLDIDDIYLPLFQSFYDSFLDSGLSFLSFVNEFYESGQVQELLDDYNALLSSHYSDYLSSHQARSNDSTNKYISINNSEFDQNSAEEQGGAIFIQGLVHQFSITEAGFVGNHAEAHGGAIFIANEASSLLDVPIVMSLDSVIMSSNSAKDNGGAIYVNSANVTLTNCDIFLNQADKGGGIYYDHGTIAFSSLNVSSNGASIGGGCYYKGRVNGSINNSTFSDNWASLTGGGLYETDFVAINYSLNDFDSNVADLSGAAIVSDGNSNSVYNTLIVQKSGVEGSGAVLCTGSSTPTFQSATIRDNHLTQEGSGVFIQGQSNPLFSDCSIINNNSTSSGAGIYLSQTARGRFINSIIANNTANGNGGGIKSIGSPSTTFDNCTIANNTAKGDGGGISIEDQSMINITNSILDNNLALASGGGIAFHGSSAANIIGVNVTNNIAITHGGGISMHDQSNSKIYNSIISGNKTPVNGAGIIGLDFSQGVVDSTEISSNTASNIGGGVEVSNTSNMTLSNCNIILNTAQSGGGIGLSNNCKANIINSNIENNEAKHTGGGIYFQNTCQPRVTSSNINSNVAKLNGGGIYVADSANPYVYNNSIYSNIVNQGNGGGIYSSDVSSGTFENNTISTNTVLLYGGGIFIASASASLNLIGNNITMNEATNGGGVFVSYSSSPMISNSAISYNTARNNGAGVYLQSNSNLNMTACSLFENIATQYGGGIYFENNTNGILSSSMINDNQANIGGGLFLSCVSTLFDNCTINSNFACYGAGISIYSKCERLPIFNQPVVTFNSAYIFGGGIIIVDSVDTIIVPSTDPFFYRAFLETNGIRSSTYPDRTIFCSPITASEQLSETTTLNRTNEALAPIPSYSAATESFTFNGAVISNNTAVNGAGIFHMSTEFSVNFGANTTLDYNYASQFGAAAFIYFLAGENPYNSSTYWLTGATFTNNTADWGGSTISMNHLPAGNIPLSALCNNCEFNTDNNYAGYQNENGFATPPAFSSMDGTCPTKLNLTNEFGVTVILQDYFNTMVHGQIYNDLVYSFEMEMPTTSDGAPCVLNVPSTVLRMPPSGMGNFSQINISSNNGDTCNLDVNYIPSNSDKTLVHQNDVNSIFYYIYQMWNFYGGETKSKYNKEQFGYNDVVIIDLMNTTIANLTCNILIQGCPNNTHVTDTQVTNAQGQSIQVDGCEDNSISLLTTIMITITLSIAFVTIILVFGYCAFVVYKKRKIKDYRFIGDLPDFDRSHKVTIQDILNDPDIANIPWDQITQYERIGIGGSGMVWRGEYHPNNKTTIQVALKQLLFGIENIPERILNEFLREIKLMSALRHENVVEFMGVSHSIATGELYLVTELMQNGSLFDLLDKKQRNLPWSLRLQLLIDAAQGMAYLHSRNLIHRDLKSQNLLVNANWVCKVHFSIFLSHSFLPFPVETNVFLPM